MPRLDKVSHPNAPEAYSVTMKDSQAFRSEEGKILYTSADVASVLARYKQAKEHFKDNPKIVIEVVDKFNNPMWEHELEQMVRTTT